MICEPEEIKHLYMMFKEIVLQIRLSHSPLFTRPPVGMRSAPWIGGRLSLIAPNSYYQKSLSIKMIVTVAVFQAIVLG
jgi:hypothetical protein